MNAKTRKRKRQRERKKANQSTALNQSSDAAQQDHADGPSQRRPHAKQSQPHRPIVPTMSSITNDSNNKPTNTSSKKFLSPDDGPEYHKLVQERYQGFAMIPANEIPASKHESFRKALEKLRDAGYYHYDMVMPGGKHLSRTFVQRTLVGDPGITYKYLGLRLFAHAWSSSGSSTTTIRTTPTMFQDIYDMNQEMIQMTQQQQHFQESRGSCQYNLTLINYMEPSCDVTLKDEEFYNMGKASVSWHADSGVQDHSSIGVYHTLPTQRRNTQWDWKIALRPNPGTNTSIRPIVVPTQSGDVYFLMNEFNHHFQHMVLAGSNSHRISSTHRVANDSEADTYQGIRDRVSRSLVAVKAMLATTESSWDWDVLLESQSVLTEVESEWIAQYWVQGQLHDTQHVWWQGPIRALEEAWKSLERQTYKIYQAMTSTPNKKRKKGAATPPPTPTRTVLQQWIAAFRHRQELRNKWDERRADKMYKRRMPRNCQPLEHPIFEVENHKKKKRLPKDLTEAIRTLNQML